MQMSTRTLCANCPRWFWVFPFPDILPPEQTVIGPFGEPQGRYLPRGCRSGFPGIKWSLRQSFQAALEPVIWQRIVFLFWGDHPPSSLTPAVMTLGVIDRQQHPVPLLLGSSVFPVDVKKPDFWLPFPTSDLTGNPTFHVLNPAIPAPSNFSDRWPGKNCLCVP